MKTSSIRLVLVDEHLSYVESLAACLDAEHDLCVVGTAANADDAFRLCLEHRPDLGLFEVETSGRPMFNCVAKVRSQQPQTKILFLSGFISEVFIQEALRLKAHGYMTKREPVTALVQAIRRVAAGQLCFSEDVKQRLQFDPQRKRYTIRSDGHLPCLTSRQLEVLRHLARGDTVKEVARTMHLSHKSIDSHKYRIMQRLGVRDRVHLSRYAIREGLILP